MRGDISLLLNCCLSVCRRVLPRCDFSEQGDKLSPCSGTTCEDHRNTIYLDYQPTNYYHCVGGVGPSTISSQGLSTSSSTLYIGSSEDVLFIHSLLCGVSVKWIILQDNGLMSHAETWLTKFNGVSF